MKQCWRCRFNAWLHRHGWASRKLCDSCTIMAKRSMEETEQKKAPTFKEVLDDYEAKKGILRSDCYNAINSVRRIGSQFKRPIGELNRELEGYENFNTYERGELAKEVEALLTPLTDLIDKIRSVKDDTSS